MPQFLPANFLPQLFWFGVIFAVLYFAVVRPTLPKLGKVIDARDRQMTGDLDAAETAKGEADRIRAAYDAGISAAQDAAQKAVAAARADAAAKVEAQVRAANARLDADAAAAEATLAAARSAARAGLAETVADLTVDAVQRLAGITVSAADAAAAR